MTWRPRRRSCTPSSTPHRTMCEAMHEASLDAYGRSPAHLRSRPSHKRRKAALSRAPPCFDPEQPLRPKRSWASTLHSPVRRRPGTRNREAERGSRPRHRLGSRPEALRGVDQEIRATAIYDPDRKATSASENKPNTSKSSLTISSHAAATSIGGRKVGDTLLRGREVEHLHQRPCSMKSRAAIDPKQAEDAQRPHNQIVPCRFPLVFVDASFVDERPATRKAAAYAHCAMGWVPRACRTGSSRGQKRLPVRAQSQAWKVGMRCHDFEAISMSRSSMMHWPAEQSPSTSITCSRSVGTPESGRDRRPRRSARTLRGRLAPRRTRSATTAVIRPRERWSPSSADSRPDRGQRNHIGNRPTGPVGNIRVDGTAPGGA